MPTEKDRAKPTRNGYLATLDGWRAIAILAVLLYHDNLHSAGPFTTGPLHHYGYLGVDLFFGISGLLITTRLLEEERLFGAFNLKGFYGRRVFRIQPPALCFLSLMLLGHLILHLPFAYRGLIQALFLVRNVANWDGARAGLRITEHFWSLSIEEQFYLVLPWTLLLLRARRARLAVLFTSGAALFAWAVLGPLKFPQYYLSERWHHTELNLHGLLLGSALAVLVSDGRVRSRVRPWLHPVIVIGGCILLIIVRDWKHHYDIIWLSAAFPFVVLSTVLHPVSWISRALEWAPLRFIGRISYSLYIWQQLFFVVGRDLAHGWTAWVRIAPLNYLITFACAIASFYCVEKPAIRLGHRLFRPPTPGRADLDEVPSVLTGPALHQPSVPST